MESMNLPINENLKETKKKNFDIIKDFNYIYASFFQVYKINLFKDKLTFKEFN